MIENELMPHFPKKVNKKIVDYARDVVFLNSRHLFIRSEKEFQLGYCTHCKKEYVTGPKGYLKHNEDYKCPHCESLVTVKQSGRGRKKLFAEAYFVWYEKSQINPEAIVSIGLHAYRDYEGDFRKVETKFRTVSMYLFEPGNSQMLVHDDWFDKWKKPKKIRSEFNNSMKNKRCEVAIESIYAAVKGTPFQYCTWEKYLSRPPYHPEDMVLFFDLVTKYPCIEYLTKLGLRKLVQAKLCGQKTYGVVNWRGKTIEKVLRLSKEEIRALRSAPIIPEPSNLHSYHFYKKHGLQLTFEEADILSDITGNSYTFDEYKKLIKHASFTKIAKYILKQLRRKDAKKHYYRSSSSVLTSLRDYWEQCQELGMDLQQEHVLFPNNLHAAHQKATEKIKIKEDKALNKLIAKRLKSLEKYTFEFNGLLVRPAKDSIELFKEGKALNHCVGMYAKKYAEGKTNLFVIRRVEEPDTPFYTMEIIGDRITQVYGKGNRLPTKEVKAFIDTFVDHQWSKTKKQRKEGVAV